MDEETAVETLVCGCQLQKELTTFPFHNLYIVHHISHSGMSLSVVYSVSYILKLERFSKHIVT